jgi:hypothetical protein
MKSQLLKQLWVLKLIRLNPLGKLRHHSLMKSPFLKQVSNSIRKMMPLRTMGKMPVQAKKMLRSSSKKNSSKSNNKL